MPDETPTTTPNEAGSEPRPAIARDKDAISMPGEPRPRPKRRRKVSYLTANKIDRVDYKDVNILRRFINDRGKILPSRQTGNTAKQQRMVAEAIRRAREMALLPFVVTEAGPERREFGPRGLRGDRGDRYERQGRAEAAPAETRQAETPAPEAPQAEAPAE